MSPSCLVYCCLFFLSNVNSTGCVIYVIIQLLARFCIASLVKDFNYFLATDYKLNILMMYVFCNVFPADRHNVLQFNKYFFK